MLAPIRPTPTNPIRSGINIPVLSHLGSRYLPQRSGATTGQLDIRQARLSWHEIFCNHMILPSRGIRTRLLPRRRETVKTVVRSSVSVNPHMNVGVNKRQDCAALTGTSSHAPLPHARSSRLPTDSSLQARFSSTF